MKLEDLEKEELVAFLRTKGFFEEEVILNILDERRKQAEIKVADAKKTKDEAYEQIKDLLESCKYVSSVNGTKKYYFSRGEYFQNKEKIDKYVKAEAIWWTLYFASLDVSNLYHKAWNDWFDAKYKATANVG